MHLLSSGRRFEGPAIAAGAARTPGRGQLLQPPRSQSRNRVSGGSLGNNPKNQRISAGLAPAGRKYPTMPDGPLSVRHHLRTSSYGDRRHRGRLPSSATGILASSRVLKSNCRFTGSAVFAQSLPVAGDAAILDLVTGLSCEDQVVVGLDAPLSYQPGGGLRLRVLTSWCLTPACSGLATLDADARR